MTDKTPARRRSGTVSDSSSAPSAAATAATQTRRPAERRDGSFDNVLERWSLGIVKEGMAERLGASTAMLRGAVALRELQIEAARRTQATHEKAAAQLRSARSLTELTSIGLMLTQADAEGAVRYWSGLAGIVANSGFEAWSEAFGALTRANGIAHSLGQHWLEATASAKPETLAAQIEHATTPVTSSPFVWPAQEAVREAMTLGARNWNEWLGSAVPAVTQAIEAATAPPTRH